MVCKVSQQPKICLIESDMWHEKSANNFKDFYINLVLDLLNQLPNAKNIFDLNSVTEIFSPKNTSESFMF